MELQELPKTPHINPESSQKPASPKADSGDRSDNVAATSLAPALTSAPPSPPHHSSKPSTLSAWWTTNIALTLPDRPPHDPRDHLALERTFLGWIRTTTVLVSLGVVVTQLFVLKDLDPTKGKVLGCVLAGAGIVIAVASARRFFRTQRLLVSGKALTGGWEAVGVWLVIGVVVGGLFLIVVIEV